MNRAAHFKDEIRNAFFTYSLVPAVIFAVVVIGISCIVWNLNFYHEAEQENHLIVHPFNDAIAAYSRLLLSNPIPSVDEIQKSSDSMAQTYAQLKEFTLRQTITADFVVLSSDFTVILQGSTDSDFMVPSWQADVCWGALGRMQKHPE
nr:hypothetical protein [Treponema sp.]